MADLHNILIFVKVAEFESITKAALSLGMPISTVSRRLSVLESGLGVALVRRTTRRVTLTPQGREYFNQCQEPQRARPRPKGGWRNIETLQASREERFRFRAS